MVPCHDLGQRAFFVRSVIVVDSVSKSILDLYATVIELLCFQRSIFSGTKRVHLVFCGAKVGTLGIILNFTGAQ